jgi:hypothetical protein
MVTLSTVLQRVASLEQHRGLRLVGEDFKTRNPAQGREWNQIGRMLHQAAAVELIEKVIDDALESKGEGKKLLKEMGGVYRRFGAARITPEQVGKVEKIIEQRRLREGILSGEQVHFSLLSTDLKFVSDCIREDFAAARCANQMDGQFKTDGPREEIVIEADGVRRNLSDEARVKFHDNADRRLAYIVEALKQHVRDEGDDDATNDRRFIFLTTFLCQRTIGAAYVPTTGLLGGDVVCQNTAGREGGTTFLINKVRDGDGQYHFKLDCVDTKEDIAFFTDPHGRRKDIKLERGSSNFSLNIHIEVSSEDLGKGNADGVMVGPVEILAQLTEDRGS